MEFSRTGGAQGAPPHFLFDEIFAGVEGIALDRPQVRDDDPVTIIYTSGTSGEAKGVVLTAANVGFMLGCTSARLDLLMGGRSGQDRIFHYLPFSFCASWIAVLTFLLRGSLVTSEHRLDENSERHAGDGSALFPERAAVARAHAARGGRADRAKGRCRRRRFTREPRLRGYGGKKSGRKRAMASWLWLANTVVFPAIRKKMVGENLKALICGSAPLTSGDAGLFQHARHSRVAGLRSDGDDRDLHHGRSATMSCRDASGRRSLALR